MKLLERFHERSIFSRRVAILAREFSSMLPINASVLDVGSGDGQLAARIMATRSDLKIEGVDVLVRPSTAIPVHQFDGTSLPFASRSFDCVMLCDVIHHIDDPNPLLREITRVARTAVVIKDHYSEHWLDEQVLRAMDWVGNARHGVALPYNYWSRAQWDRTYASLGLEIDASNDRLHLYSLPLDFVFGRRLHFITRLTADPSR